MTWAYVWATISAGKHRGRLFMSIVMTLGVLPDVDLFLRGFGVLHHSFTHSLFFWFILSVPFFVVYRRRVVPFLVAVVQHFAFGDLLFGIVMIAWPFSQSFFGLGIAMPSTLDIVFEIGGLLLAGGVSFFNGDLKRILSVSSASLLMLLPFLALLVSMLSFRVGSSSTLLITYILSSGPLTVLVLAHLVLLAVLGVSALQGLRSLSRDSVEVPQRGRM